MLDLLSDIESEKHAFLLEKGNLPGVARILQSPKQSSWTGENSWVSQGYLAQILRTKCTCGFSQDSLQGIFHVEKSPSGAIRKQALDLRRFQIPLQSDLNHLELTYHLIPLCLSCLPGKGFPSLTESLA